MTKPPPKVLFILPNLFTVSSIFCGMYAIFQAVGDAPDRFYKAAVAIIFAVLFDSLDGRVARITKTQSDFGIQLDSLADLVSFGVAPALVMWRWALSDFGWLGFAVAFGYVACGALRLARFNVLATSQSGPSSRFVGLPIPLAAITLASLLMLHYRTGGVRLEGQPLVLVVMGGLALLMVSNFPYRTFKKLRADRLTIGLILAVVGSVVFAGIMTSFSLMFVVVTGGMISLGLAEGLVGLVRRRLMGANADRDVDEDEQEEEEPAA